MQHESVASDKGKARAGSTSADRLEHQAAVRFAPRSKSSWLADMVFAFHESEEIGSRMLPRIAKVSGLKPEDL